MALRFWQVGRLWLFKWQLDSCMVAAGLSNFFMQPPSRVVSQIQLKTVRRRENIEAANALESW
jgi:hypothetical protein